MMERAKKVGGQIDIRRLSPQGTEVRVRIPGKIAYKRFVALGALFAPLVNLEELLLCQPCRHLQFRLSCIIEKSGSAMVVAFFTHS